eukprot:CAMPEP_0201506940 /NCGR_PEP_ID=MMETSP0161_2-20130828/763_1 /ASSEMBLY_ACC=CAM_ASM_000251 /TAXON_ID=180227 /ORGANISM="Neoparamoeba aestuarina, Strain SoJaBio B1-5/56/2" /LENGTH=129 /DNA_ID=CAMNT_0047901185 /DNA_START=501 /DNA_END=890 /DNA_ORIENTATION=-
METVKYKNVQFNVFDLGGQTSIRPYWRCYYQYTDAIIYVVDSADHERISVSKEELVAMLQEEELKNASLLVFANKQDLQGAASEVEVSEALGLGALKDREWSIFKTSAVEGVGLYEGLDWLVNSISSKN